MFRTSATYRVVSQSGLSYYSPAPALLCRRRRGAGNFFSAAAARRRSKKIGGVGENCFQGIPQKFRSILKNFLISFFSPRKNKHYQNRIGGAPTKYRRRRAPHPKTAAGTKFWGR